MRAHDGIMINRNGHYGFGIAVKRPFLETAEQTRAELSREGFGILTEVDVAATFKKKLDVDFPPYLILGACNPPLAYRALTAEREIGLLLPCNVIVYSDDREGLTRVAAMDPEVALELTGNEQVVEVAREVKTRLERVLARIAAV